LRTLCSILGHERWLWNRLLEPVERPVRVADDLAVGEQHRRRRDTGGTPVLRLPGNRHEGLPRVLRALVRERPAKTLGERRPVELDHFEVRHARDPGGGIAPGQGRRSAGLSYRQSPWATPQNCFPWRPRSPQPAAAAVNRAATRCPLRTALSMNPA